MDSHLLPQQGAIIWTNVDLFLFGPMKTNASKNFNQNATIFMQEN